MTTAAPTVQAFKTYRSGEIESLSSFSYMLLLALGSLATLIGVQYGVFFMAALNTIALVANMLIMALLSRRLLTGFLLTLSVCFALTATFAPWALRTLVTTKWAEQVGFLWGVLAVTTFLPQVLTTRRTRSVAALSLGYLSLFTAGMVVWIIVAMILGSVSLVIWNTILGLMIAELLRLKLRHGRSSPPHADATLPSGIA